MDESFGDYVNIPPVSPHKLPINYKGENGKFNVEKSNRYFLTS